MDALNINNEVTTENFLSQVNYDVAMSVFWSQALKGTAKKFADVCRTRKKVQKNALDS